MKVKLNEQTIKSINLFQNITGSSVVDCIHEKDEIYFVVASGQYGISVGKHGSKIKNAERLFKKNIYVFEYSPDLEHFIKNLIPESQEIEIDSTGIKVKVRNSDKPKVIGKAGKNIKIINRFLERLFDVDSLKVK